MGKLKPFLFGTIFGGSILFVALQYHLVHSNEGFRLVPRNPQPSIGLAYADVRQWGTEEWADRSELAQAIIANGSTDLITGSVTEELTQSLAPEGSTLDTLRQLMDETNSSSGTESRSNSSGFLSIPQDNESATESSDLFSIPFPQDARESLNGSTAARGNDFTQEPATNVARRELPSIEDILGESSNKPTSAPPSTPTQQTQAVKKLPSSFDPVAETEAMEDLLFGNDDGPAEPTSSTRNAVSGMFEDVTSEVQQRTEQTLGRVQEEFQYQTRQKMNETANSVDEYVRDRVRNAVPDSVSSMFQQDGSAQPSQQPTQKRSIAPAWQAIQDGFDPFIK